MKLHVLTSWSKPAKLALSAFVIVVGGLVLPLTGMFTSTASAAMNAKECYEKYNNKSTASFSSYPNPSNAYDTSCTTQQFCSIETVTSMAGGF